MGLFDFVKEAGSALFGGDDDKKDAQPEVRTLDKAKADRNAAARMVTTVQGMGFDVEDLEVKLMDGLVTVGGKVDSQADREKIILLLGNTQGVARVDDRLVVEKPEPEATMYTVKSGDSLSKIAKAHYGDPMKYTKIFEANQPMLKDPNKIFPGQTLRIPPKEA